MQEVVSDTILVLHLRKLTAAADRLLPLVSECVYVCMFVFPHDFRRSGAFTSSFGGAHSLPPWPPCAAQCHCLLSYLPASLPVCLPRSALFPSSPGARALFLLTRFHTSTNIHTHTATLTALSHLVFGVLIYSKSISSRLDSVGKCFTLQQCCHGFTCSALQFTIFLHLTSLSLSATNMVIHA